jgi:hypothetical protein
MAEPTIKPSLTTGRATKLHLLKSKIAKCFVQLEKCDRPKPPLAVALPPLNPAPAVPALAPAHCVKETLTHLNISKENQALAVVALDDLHQDGGVK